MIIVSQPERAARLEVLPDSSLRIHHLHTEDAGQYECQQYVNGQLYEGGTPVVLNLLTITADSSRDLKRGTALALQCTLVCNGGIADCRSVPDNVKLTWVDDEGTALQGDSSNGLIVFLSLLEENLVLIATASAAAIALLIVLILAVAFCVWKRRRSDSDNHVQDEELTKESVSEIPAQVTVRTGCVNDNEMCHNFKECVHKQI
ncbi:hypothetical protein EOD39_18335 [Acipenser ruthenus]|uniref:Ig-like domain-containing protein n=1 Tax=Acipenser ruthenus TaxID=7906 RepID=A0A444V163_ACIRT|nr:hypothetical protein EOD39_18335 [Acipenser ruthenus]